MTTEEAGIWGFTPSPSANILVMLLILSQLVTNTRTAWWRWCWGRAEPCLGQEFANFWRTQVWQTLQDSRLAANPASCHQSGQMATCQFPQEVNPDWFKPVGILPFPLLGFGQGMDMWPSSGQWVISRETNWSDLPETKGVPRIWEFRYKMEKYPANPEKLVIQDIRGNTTL